MRNITVHNYDINANLKKEITICHISDCHLTEYDKFSTKEEIDESYNKIKEKIYCGRTRLLQTRVRNLLLKYFQEGFYMKGNSYETH